MTAREEEQRNILESGPLHRAMVFFQQAEELGAPGIVVIQFLAAGLVSFIFYAWSAPLHFSIYAATVLFVFSLGDAVLWLWLPRRGISFGPWKAQTAVLLTPRTLACVTLAAIGPWLGWTFALATLILAQICGSLLLWWAAVIEPQRLELTYLDMHVDTLPPDSEPVRLLHISDIHLERLTGREEKLIALTREARPDIILMTGDYLNLSYNSDELTKRQVADLLARLEAPYGVYATLGSPPADARHEIVPVLEALPLCLLRDEWVEVQVGHDKRLTLLGLDCTHFWEEDAVSLARVAATAPNGAPRVLLYHSPELMPEAGKHSIDLYVCGHTHGGQVRLPLVGPILTSSQLGRRYVMGHYRQGDVNLYVSRGVGLEGLSAPRVRLLAPPEITLITLHPAPSGSSNHERQEESDK